MKKLLAGIVAAALFTTGGALAQDSGRSSTCVSVDGGGRCLACSENTQLLGGANTKQPLRCANMAKGVAYLRFLDFRLSHPNATEPGAALHAHALVRENGTRHQFAEFQGSCLVAMEFPRLSIEMGPIESGQDIDVTWLLMLCEGCASVCRAEVSSVELGVVP